jgi:hypothetical protein
VHLEVRSCCVNFSLVGNFPRLARNSPDISKGNFLESDRQFEYHLLRHAHVVVIQRLFLSMRGPANLRHCLKNFGCRILQYARGEIFSQITRVTSARILWWRVS